MTSHRIKLIIEGLDIDDGHVRLEVFASELQKLHTALGRADAHVSNGKRCSFFAVVGLSHSSPATIELEARVASNAMHDCRTSALSLLAGAIEAVQRGEFNENSDFELLNDIKELASPVGETLKAARILIHDKQYPLTATLANAVKAVQAEQEECITTVEGMLERVNVHDEANVFTIFPDVGPSRIKCRLPEYLTEKGIGAIRRRVAVSGVAKFRKFTPFPHEIEATQIEVYGVDAQLPGWYDLLGLAPDATDDLTSEDFVRQVRDEWE